MIANHEHTTYTYAQVRARIAHAAARHYSYAQLVHILARLGVTPHPDATLLQLGYKIAWCVLPYAEVYVTLHDAPVDNNAVLGRAVGGQQV